jgi:hypothetical protein
VDFHCVFGQKKAGGKAHEKGHLQVFDRAPGVEMDKTKLHRFPRVIWVFSPNLLRSLYPFYHPLSFRYSILTKK